MHTQQGDPGMENTPTGNADRPVIHLPMLMPYILIVVGSFLATIFHPASPYTTGYFYLTFFNILTYLGLLVTILLIISKVLAL